MFLSANREPRSQRPGAWLWRVLAVAALLTLAAAHVRADDLEMQTVALGAPRVARQADFPSRSTSAAGAVRRFNLKESHLQDFALAVPIKPLPPEFKGIITPPAEKSVSRVRSRLDFGNAVTLELNRPLKTEETQGNTSTVCSPSMAVRGNEVLLTGNWFAAFSKDGGQSFKFIDPAAAFPEPEGQPFCCGQVVLYDPKSDLMFWLLEHMNNSDGNILRLAVARGNDIAGETWHLYDLTAQQLGSPKGEWLDYGELAVGDKFLYLTANVFTGKDNRFVRSVTLRLGLDGLGKYGQLAGNSVSSREMFSPRPTQGARGTMYFASNLTPRSFALVSWPEAADKPKVEKVVVEAWQAPGRTGYQAPGPDGRNWLNRTDPRITAAWVARGNIGFAWTAPQDGNFPYPHVRCAILDENSHKVVAQPPLWSKEHAFAYPAAAPNADGTVGISVAYGGNKFHPSHAVGVLRPGAAANDWKWELLSTATGTDGPEKNTWGDYLTVRPHGKEPASWVATGYTLQGGSDRTNVQVQYLRFRVKSE